MCRTNECEYNNYDQVKEWSLYSFRSIAKGSKLVRPILENTGPSNNDVKEMVTETRAQASRTSLHTHSIST